MCVARVVGQAGDGGAQAVVARPAECDGLGLAGLVGQRGDAGLGGEVIVAVEALTHAAQFGEDLGGADASGAREAHQDAAIVEVGQLMLDAAGELADLLDDGLQGRDDAAHEGALGLEFDLVATGATA